MWLFEKRGFVSVVAYDPKKDRNTQSEFRKIAKQADTHLLVRARIKEDLDWLKDVQPNLVIETDAGADYAFRAVIPRKKFKTALANAVDGITYDSHFKEVARDNSPKSQGRYSAMMSVWTAMSKLQPIAPWSGGGWSSGWYGSSKPVSPPASSSPGAKDVEEFIEQYVASGGETTYRNGGGPRTGFKVGDRVIGYSGAGEVVEVSESKFSAGAESVRVKMDEGGKVATFISNYLMPEDLPAIEDDGEAHHDLDGMWEFLRKLLNGEQEKVLDFPQEELQVLSDGAFDLLTRMQELVENSGTFDPDHLDEAYDEILWETSSDAERRDIWASAATVPARYENEAIRLFNALEVSGAK